jgi:hypothetical protein
LHPNPNPNRTGPDATDTFKNTINFLNFCFIRKNIIFNFIHKQQRKKISYLKFRKKTSESSESGFSCCRRASRTRPVSLNTRSLVVDDAGIERSGGAKRNNCGKIDQCFFHHYVVTDIDFEHLLKHLVLFFFDIFCFSHMIIHITNLKKTRFSPL